MAIMFHRKVHNQTLEILLIFFVILNFYQNSIFMQCAIDGNVSNIEVTTEYYSTTILAESTHIINNENAIDPHTKDTSLITTTIDSEFPYTDTSLSILTVQSTSPNEGSTNTESATEVSTKLSTTEFNDEITNEQTVTTSSVDLETSITPEQTTLPIETTTPFVITHIINNENAIDPNTKDTSLITTTIDSEVPYTDTSIRILTIQSTSLNEGSTNTESATEVSTKLSTTEFYDETTNEQTVTTSSVDLETSITPEQTTFPIETTTPFVITEENCRNKVQIEKFEITDITSESLHVDWKTTENFENCVDRINITWFDENDNEKFQDLNFNLEGTWNITDLWPCRSYNITIQLIGPNEEFIVNQKSIKEETDSIVPKAVKLDHNSTANSIELLWETTNERDKYCITGFTIIVSSSDCNETVTLGPEDKKHNIGSLRPCSEYSITIMAIGINSLMGEETSEDIRTLSEAPSAVKLILETNKNTINVTWSSDSQKGMECLQGYQISYKLHNEKNYQFNEIFEKTENTYLIDELKYCTEYDVEVLPIGEEQNGTVAKESTTTDFIEPSKVQNFELTADKNNIKVEWEAPIDAPECVIEYQITCQLESPGGNSKLIIHNSSKSPDTFDNLYYCSTYKIEITPLGQGGKYGNTTSNIKETEEIDVVDEVGELTATPDTKTIIVEWEAPTHSACVQQYKIICIAKDFDFRLENYTTELNFTYSDLEPCTEYNITVEPVTISGTPSKSRYTVSTTLAITPSKVNDIKIESPQPFALNISWSPPETAKYCVKKYAVNIGDTTEFTESITKVMKNLTACVEYEIVITPITSDGEQGESSSPEKGKTSPFVTNAPTLVDTIVDRKAATLNYSLDIETNVCKLNFATTICTCDKSEEQSKIVTTPFPDSDTFEKSMVNFQVNITDILAFTEYTCKTSINNIAGNSEENSTNIKTLADVPGKPIFKENETELSTNSFVINWQHPESIPGAEYSETLEIIELGPNYTIPQDCDKPNEKEPFIKTFVDGEKSFQYEEALPYTKYAIKIYGTTEAGSGSIEEKVLVTNPSVSSTVRDLEVLINYNSDKNISYPYDILVKWLSPCNSSGTLQNFFIKLNEKNILVEAVENQLRYLTSLEDLKPETNYIIEVFAQTLGTSHSPGVVYDFITPAGVPNYTSDYFKIITVDPHKTTSPEYKAELAFASNVFSNAMGSIKFYSIIVSKAGSEDNQKFESWNDTGNNWVTDIAKWPNNPYQATPERWSPTCRAGKQCVYHYIIGNENCKETNVNENYCNGPLHPNTNYSVRIRGFTSKGFCDTPSIYFQTAVAFNVGIIIAVVISIFIFGTCLSFAIYFKNGNASVWIKSIFLCKDISTSGSQNTVMPPRISIQNFPAHCIMLRSNANQLSSEFSLLETLSDDIALLTYTGDLPHNRVKNRYPNIKPYDVTRVKLRVVPDEFSDYINASYIKGYSSDVEYIATQGPKEETIDDFWQMVYENDVKQIVMVTNLTEKGKNKCYKYYPEELDPVTCNNGIELECEFIEFRQAFTIRHICLKKKNNPYIIERKLIHLQFHEWPDFGVPQSTDSVLKLCREIRSHQAQNFGVVVVHCSAGVGRTGTIIAIDILVQAIHANRKIDVFGTVLNLRKQRQHMVKNEGQYAFIYSCLRDEILNPRVFQGTDRHSSSYTSFYERGYYNFYDDADLRKLSIESAM